MSVLAFTVLAACGAAEPKFGNIDDERLLNADKEPENWLAHGGNLQEHRHSLLTQVNTQNVGRLGPAWVFEFDTIRGQEATPIVVDGVMYVTTALSKVYALDARTGRQLWFYDPQVKGEQFYKPCCDVVNRGPAVYKGKVYVAAIDGRLIALDAETGKEVWSTVTVDQTKMYAVTNAPRVIRDKVIIGNAGGDFGVRGYVSAYDAATGKLAWRFYLVPGDPAKGPDGAASDEIMEKLVRPTWFGDKYWVYGGGGTAWSEMTYDPEFKRIYIGTGNGSPWNHGYRSEGKGDNLFLASIVALDIDTGKYAWHYQQNPGESWDYNSVQPIILADLTIGGAKRKALMHAPKNGFFYVIDRATGKLISAEPFVPVKWATHVDLKTGRPVEVPGVRYETAPATVNVSAHSWPPFAYNPTTGLVYFGASEATTEFAQPYKFNFVEGLDNAGSAYGPFERPPGWTPPPRSAGPPRAGRYLLGWDPVTQKARWKVDGAGGAALSTAGGLVFVGRSRESVMGVLEAYDAATGKKLWSHDTPNAILPGPISYAVDGEQYVATVGGANAVVAGGPARLPQPGRVVVFKLGGAAKLPDGPPLAPPIQAPPGEWSKAALDEGRERYTRICARCHGQSARSGNIIPDLRRAQTLDDPAAWKEVVIDGILAPNGMVGWSKFLTPAQAENIRGYVVTQARIAQKEDEATAARARAVAPQPAGAPDGQVGL